METESIPTATHYQVIAGRSEGVNLPTLSDAQYLADGQAAAGILPVHVYAVLTDGTHIEI